MTLGAILLTLAIPAYQALIAQNRQTTQITQLVAAINLARSEAVTRHSIVTLCKSNDGKQCAGEWRDGWLVFVDKQASGQVDLGDVILRIYPPIPLGSSLEWAGQRSNAYLQMDPSGGTHGQAGTFTYYPHQGEKYIMSKIIISQTGRIRIETTS